MPSSAYKHAGIDTIASDDGGHRGTGGGDGEEQGWIVGGGRILKYARYVMYVGNKGLSGHRRAGRCMHVHGMACMCGMYLLPKHRLPSL